MTRMKHVSFFSVTLALLTIILLACVFAFPVNVTFQAAAVSPDLPIDTNAEYANGSISLPPYGHIWYTWINTSTTQVISYALFSDQVNSPILNLLGQHFQLSDGTEVFVANTLSLMELYNDTSGDGLPQANFTSGDSEIAYYLLANSSLSYEVTPVHKVVKEGLPHYEWGFRYEGVDAALLCPEEQPGNAAAMGMIDYIGFSYDLYVVGNVSYMKPSFDIGKVLSIQQLPACPSVSLDGLSLSMLFATATVSTRSSSAYVNGEVYNSTTADSPSVSMESGQIGVETVKAFEFLFGEDYNLTRGMGTETHEAKYEAAATSSVPTGAYSSLEWIIDCFERNLNATLLFGGMKEELSLACNSSDLLYRICYPVWDGFAIQHDPIYVAYLFSDVEIPEFPASLVLLVLMLVVSSVALVGRVGKRRKPALQVRSAMLRQHPIF